MKSARILSSFDSMTAMEYYPLVPSPDELKLYCGVQNKLDDLAARMCTDAPLRINRPFILINNSIQHLITDIVSLQTLNDGDYPHHDKNEPAELCTLKTNLSQLFIRLEKSADEGEIDSYRTPMKELLGLWNGLDSLAKREISTHERNTDKPEEISKTDRTGGACSSALVFGSWDTEACNQK